MSFNYCSSLAILNKAGTNLNVTVQASQALVAEFCDAAERFVNQATRYDWSSVSDAILTTYPWIAPTDAIICLAAIDCIHYDIDAVGRSTGEDRINVLYDKAMKVIENIKKIKTPELNIT